MALPQAIFPGRTYNTFLDDSEGFLPGQVAGMERANAELLFPRLAQTARNTGQLQ